DSPGFRSRFSMRAPTLSRPKVSPGGEASVFSQIVPGMASEKSRRRGGDGVPWTSRPPAESRRTFACHLVKPANPDQVYQVQTLLHLTTVRSLGRLFR